MIKNIIFDVGDVLLEYRWKDMLKDYGLPDDEAYKVGNLMFNDNLWHEFDLANMTRDEIVGQYLKNYPDYAKVMQWFMTHGELMHVKREDVWEKAQKLKEKGYGIYILSNYSQELFEKHTKDAPFISLADGVVVSYQIHITKPDEKIYRYLLDKYNLKAEECIFFDDREENTEAARKLGIEAITVTSKEFLLDELDKLL
ncbi:MAG: HAD family phosphatase [Lachnospiraceae bacterium]|jgi:putative hydrolase of the HAD superfamily|nr:HAD family phosphatase [Lachnospiraceae bacterium]